MRQTCHIQRTSQPQFWWTAKYQIFKREKASGAIKAPKEARDDDLVPFGLSAPRHYRGRGGGGRNDSGFHGGVFPAPLSLIDLLPSPRTHPPFRSASSVVTGGRCHSDDVRTPAEPWRSWSCGKKPPQIRLSILCRCVAPFLPRGISFFVAV